MFALAVAIELSHGGVESTHVQYDDQEYVSPLIFLMHSNPNSCSIEVSSKQYWQKETLLYVSSCTTIRANPVHGMSWGKSGLKHLTDKGDSSYFIYSSVDSSATRLLVRMCVYERKFSLCTYIHTSNIYNARNTNYY